MYCVYRAKSELVPCLAISTTFLSFHSIQFDSTQVNFVEACCITATTFTPNIQLLNNILSLLLLNNDKHKTSLVDVFYHLSFSIFPQACVICDFSFGNGCTHACCLFALCVSLCVCPNINWKS